jgi:PPR repeat
MIATAQNEERWRMTPDTVSFNIAISALAQGKERDSGSRSEALLFKMENLSSELGWECTSDNISFNSVINNWASSRSPGAAQRAMEIMDHMIRRYDRGVSSVTPDDITYSVVLKALSKSKHKHAIDQAEELFEDYRDAVEAGKWDLTHSALTWNSMINCYAKSRRQDAGQKAMELYKTMKSHAGKPGWERCNVDTYTYTSLIDAISKDESFESSEEAIRLLKEIEKSYAETNDQLFEPNILLYTAVVNAIGRSHKDPERAQKIVDRVESTYLQSVNTDQRPPTPDVSFYNALINAYGWSDMTGRSHKSFQVLQHMIDLSKGRDLPRARPDIISYNSVLNACAYEKTTSQADSDEIMKIVIEIFENLTSNTKRRGSPRPQPKTYTQVLIAISNHMPSDSEKKALLAEAVFFKCAEDGLVNPQVVMVLDGILPKSRFQDIMGDALNKELHDSGKLGFDLKNLPLEWTKNSRERGPPNQSLKTKDGFQVTKNVQSKLSKEKAKAYQ